MHRQFYFAPALTGSQVTPQVELTKDTKENGKVTNKLPTPRKLRNGQDRDEKYISVGEQSVVASSKLTFKQPPVK